MTQLILSIIGIGLLLAVFTELFFLMRGRKKGDQQIIEDQLRQNKDLSKEIKELKAYRDYLLAQQFIKLRAEK